MKFTNGTIRINNINRDIFWWGLYATHVLEKFNKKDGIHNLTHLEIQQVLKQSKIIVKKPGTKRTYFALSQYSDGIYVTYFILTSTQAVIKTNFKRANTMKHAKRLLKISGVKSKKKNNPEQNTLAIHNFYKENKAVREDFKRLNEIDAQYGIEQINVDELDEFEQKVLKKHNIILK